MANELRYRHTTGGLSTLYAVMFYALDPDAMVNASTGASLAVSSANWASADIALTAVSGTNLYLGSIPSGTSEGDYDVSVYLMNGATADEDADTELGQRTIGWSGSALVPSAGNVTYINGETANPQNLPSVSVSAPFDPDSVDDTYGTLTIIQGDAYLTTLTSDGSAIDIEITDGGQLPNDVTTATVSLKLNSRLKTGTTTSISGTIPTPTGSTKTFRFEMTAAQTAALEPGDNAYDGYVVVLVGGTSTNVRKFKIRINVIPDLL